MEHEGRHFPNRLRRYRKLEGFTQKEVAHLLEVQSEVLVSNWERGKFLPSGINLMKLCLLYKALPQDLYTGLILELKEELAVNQEKLFLNKESLE